MSGHVKSPLRFIGTYGNPTVCGEWCGRCYLPPVVVVVQQTAPRSFRPPPRGPCRGRRPMVACAVLLHQPRHPPRRWLHEPPVSAAAAAATTATVIATASATAAAAAAAAADTAARPCCRVMGSAQHSSDLLKQLAAQNGSAMRVNALCCMQHCQKSIAHPAGSWGGTKPPHRAQLRWGGWAA